MLNQDSSAFCVIDKEQRGNPHTAFTNWLEEKGYRFSHKKGWFGCEWLFVNVNTKVYAYGMPGVALANPVGNTKITINEFKIIYNILNNQLLKHKAQFKDLNNK